MVFHVFNAFNYWFQRHLKSKFTAIAAFVAYIVTAAYRVVLMISGQSVTWFALATSVDYVCVAVLLVYFYKKEGGRSLGFSWKYGVHLLSRSKHYILAGLMASIYGQTDKLMLKQLMDDAMVGYYGVAVSLSTMWGFVLQAVIDSVSPRIIDFWGKDRRMFERRNRQLYAMVFYFAVGVSLVISLLAKPIVLILYGQQYAPTVLPLRIVVWYTAFSYLGVARNAWMVCENRQKYLKYLYTAAAAINVVLNWFLIPIWGAAGAAATSLLTQIATTIFLPAVVKPLRPNVKLMLEAILLRDL